MNVIPKIGTVCESQRHYHRSMLFLLTVLTFLMTLPRTASSDIKSDMEEHFSSLEVILNSIAEMPQTRATNLRNVDQHFISLLREHPSINSILRTNSNGVLINQVIRGRSPIRATRNVSGQRWYRTVSNSDETYFGYTRERGRYFLFWAKQLFNPAGRYVGTVVVKYDLEESLRDFASETDDPFVVSISDDVIFSHNWDANENISEQKLNVPGIDDLVLKATHKTDVAQEEQVSANDLAAAVDEEEATTEETAVAEENEEGRSILPIFLFIFAGIGLVGTVVGVKINIAKKNERLLKELESD
ncbi:cache domain-containing protein [Chitinispirillales bacterium ANBcel5]|uniref:cache domain-containing protein n=1 Tax=Cellulosispirillum alkaliphilum TaxID=3039283 RepID=UPI002A53FBA0|nr:cache domain-containing protein [Chitinispirillales bacterium ANBcel5]